MPQNKKPRARLKRPKVKASQPQDPPHSQSQPQPTLFTLFTLFTASNATFTSSHPEVGGSSAYPSPPPTSSHYLPRTSASSITSSISNISPTTSPSTIAKGEEKRRASSVFHRRFSFSLPLSRGQTPSASSTSSSERRSSDLESLSPTTTISPKSLSSIKTTPPKLQLKCTCGMPICTQCKKEMEMSLEFVFGKAPPEGSCRGRDLGSVDESVPLSPVCFKVHPGTLVTFTSSSPPPPPLSLPRRGSGFSSEGSNESYEHHRKGSVKEARRRTYRGTRDKSLRSPRCASLPGPGYFYGCGEGIGLDEQLYQRTSRLQNIDYKARKLERRTRSMGERDRVLREGRDIYHATLIEIGTARLSSGHRSTSVGMEGMRGEERKESRGSGRSTSSSSISSDSAEAFLKHVRASMEARRRIADQGKAKRAFKKASYDVFVDEKEKGFIGDEPL
ncbi:hypothetical protein K469DRAFT_57506 [Zopfia rhizophila CBS 207.26]|uniref:Uncharacterized protein n=1 Tax=Zopfia rhizophila CBS 207.26 TaxID=1314779 RepID=A0A6A6DDD7_9PEZI|nr:hypothetical protein K469DRAFT_57506 [Zopfia rhizophila CBS 207.26]